MPHRCFLGFSPGQGKAELRKQMERKPWRNKSGTVSRGQRWAQSSPRCPGNWTVPTEPPALLPAPGRHLAPVRGRGEKIIIIKKGNINANSGIGVFSFIESPQAPTTSPPGLQHPTEDLAFLARGCWYQAGAFRSPWLCSLRCPRHPPGAPLSPQAHAGFWCSRRDQADKSCVVMYLFIDFQLHRADNHWALCTVLTRGFGGQALSTAEQQLQRGGGNLAQPSTFGHWIPAAFRRLLLFTRR